MAAFSAAFDGAPVVDPRNPHTRRDGLQIASTLIVPGAESALLSVNDAPHGTVSQVWYASPALKMNRRVYVYTPPGYEAGRARYPVLYLFHGTNGTSADWTTAGRANFIADNLIAAKKMVPMIIVMPLGHAAPYGGRGDNNALFERYVLEEVIPLVEGKYRVKTERENRAIMGLSMGGVVGYMVPTLWLRATIRKNQRELNFSLPDALDLMVVCVEAGLTIDAAMQRVGQELAIAHPRLSRELAITHMETRVGLSRSEALRNLGQRTGAAAVQSLVAMLIQADRFGTSIAESLRVQADTLRTRRRQRAEERAAKIAVKLLFPLIFFIFPSLMVVLLGSPALQFYRSLMPFMMGEGS